MLLDEEYMLKAIALAKEAEKIGECPIGAIIINKNGEIIGKGYNRVECDNSPVAHAEIIAIEEAAGRIGRRLTDCTMYVTLEPCAMCAGALMNARIKRIVYGAFDERFGACTSMFNLFDYPVNHVPFVRSMILGDECKKLLTDFFKKLRQ